MSDTEIKDRPAKAEQPSRVPVCRDHDEDCDDIADKVSCWLYDPCKGRCPFLSKH